MQISSTERFSERDSMDESLFRAHIRALDDCNQRGGRMLSLVDLIAAGTVDLPLAAYLAAAMRSGASLLLGARPGGAGKTTVMSHEIAGCDQSAICPKSSPDHRLRVEQSAGGRHFHASDLSSRQRSWSAGHPVTV